MLEKNSIEGSVMHSPLRKKVVSKIMIIMDVTGGVTESRIVSDLNVTKFISYINWESF